MPRVIRVYRRDQATTPSSFTDPGVLQVTSSLAGLLSGECPEDQIASMIGALLSCFGTVSTSAAAVNYLWIECDPPEPRWKYICIAATTFELADGGASPVVVKLDLKSLYPF